MLLGHALLPLSATPTTNPLHAGADLRVGASLQAAALPVGAGARTPSEHDRPDANAGEIRDELCA